MDIVSVFSPIYYHVIIVHAETEVGHSHVTCSPTTTSDMRRGEILTLKICKYTKGMRAPVEKGPL